MWGICWNNGRGVVVLIAVGGTFSHIESRFSGRMLSFVSPFFLLRRVIDEVSLVISDLDYPLQWFKVKIASSVMKGTESCILLRQELSVCV